MRVIARKTLQEFWNGHADAREQLLVWLSVAEKSDWSSPAQIKQMFRSADILPDNRVVFNIKGNRYRLIVKIHYNTGIVFIRFVGTHAEYERIDAETI